MGIGKNKSNMKRFTVVKNLPTHKKLVTRTKMVFRNQQPHGAALKAARRGLHLIYLLEHKTKKIHIFKGKLKQVKTGEDAPEWVTRPFHKKPFVKKVRIHKMD